MKTIYKTIIMKYVSDFTWDVAKKGYRIGMGCRVEVKQENGSPLAHVISKHGQIVLQIEHYGPFTRQRYLARREPFNHFYMRGWGTRGQAKESGADEKEVIGDLGSIDKGDGGIRSISRTPISLAEMLRASAEPDRAYQPLQEHSALYVEFADLQPTLKDILAFAHQYGPLEQEVDIQFLYDGNSSSEELCRASRLDLWEIEMYLMDQAVTLWNTLRAKNWKALAERLRVDGHTIDDHYFSKKMTRKSPPVFYVFHVLDPPPPWPHGGKPIAPKELEEPGWYYLQCLISARLAGRISPYVQRGDGKKHAPSLGLASKNLIGAMWLQLARAVEEEGDYKRCAYCDAPFSITVGDKRRHAQFCGPSHQKLAWQREHRRTQRETGSDTAWDAEERSKKAGKVLRMPWRHPRAVLTRSSQPLRREATGRKHAADDG